MPPIPPKKQPPKVVQVPETVEVSEDDAKIIEEFREFLHKEREKREAAAATPRDEKVRYVKGQGQTRSHHCHWPGCPHQVPPAMWGCKRHWFMLPKHLRDAIWAAYRPGQEVNGTPSIEYVRVALEVQEWIRERHPG